MIIVRFRGGLGNQMFQYALYRKMQLLGNTVCADLSLYENKRAAPFVLTDAFPNASRYFKIGLKAEDWYNNLPSRSLFSRVLAVVFPEKSKYVFEREDSKYAPFILRCKDCVLDGYWQTEKYWKDIKDIIRAELSFHKEDSDDLNDIEAMIQQNVSVCVHVRRGDYLLPQNQLLFSNICTKEYYRKAQEVICHSVSNAKFFFFSDDIEWVKENLQCRDAVFVQDYIGTRYPDWYEMYLMSICKHNIIANSTFSWWGAYLNDYDNKIVVAPANWINNKKTPDILPESWIKIDGRSK